MNRLELEILAESDEVRFVIDGVDLIERVRAVELPQAKVPSIAGAYAGLPTRVALPPSRELFGENDEDAEVALAICNCGEPGCWPLLATVTVEDTQVTWDNFHQPFRDEESGSQWTYESFGPFVFARDAYEQALAHPIRTTTKR